MYISIRGIYENGVVTLLEPAPTEERTEVIITFLSEIKAEDPSKKRIEPNDLI